jgi:hypothetical protein
VGVSAEPLEMASVTDRATEAAHRRESGTGTLAETVTEALEIDR